MPIDLKPCPFCGGEAHFLYTSNGCVLNHHVGCVGDTAHWYESKEKAATAWNTRHETGSSCVGAQDDKVEENQQPDECPPKCNRFVALNCEKFTDCCDRRHCRYELRCILECISLDTTHGAGQRNRERAKEAIRLLPQLTAMKRESGDECPECKGEGQYFYEGDYHECFTCKPQNKVTQSDELTEDFDQEQSRNALTDDARELLRQPLIQSLLYDLNLLPEQITKYKHWYYMLAVVAHMGQAMKAPSKEYGSLIKELLSAVHTPNPTNPHMWHVKPYVGKEFSRIIEALSKIEDQEPS